MAYLDSTGLQKQIQYIKAYVANQISAIASNGTANRATADGLGNNIASTYATKAELSAIPQFDIQVVNALPTANISDTTVYLVLSNSGAAGNLYAEYIHVNDAWEKLGEYSTNIDLSDYMLLSGGTLTGNIYTTPYYDATIESPEGGQTLIVSKGVSTKGTPPAEDEWHTLAMAVDSTGSTNNLHKYGQMETAVYANGKTESYLTVYKNEANSTTGAKIAIGYDANGNVYTAAPTPSAADNSTKIATTAYVNTKLSGYAASSHDHDTSDITSGTLAIARGGTGQTSAVNACNAFLNALTTGSSVPGDADYYISQYANGGTTTTTFHRRPMSALYSYIKDKTDTLYASKLNLGSTQNYERYCIFASAPDAGSGNISATLLLTQAGNFGGGTQGAWLIQLSTRNGITMKVVTLIANTSGTIQFGYYTANNIHYFGFYTATYRGSSEITIMGNAGFTLSKISDTATKPTGWTAVSPTSFANSSHSHSYLPLSGGTLTGEVTTASNIILDKSETSPVQGTSINLPFQYKTKTTASGNAVYTTTPFFAFPTSDTSNNGVGFGIQTGGAVVIGGGESPKALVSAIPINGATENLYLTADSTVYVYTNGNTIANRKEFSFGTDGKLTAATFAGSGASLTSLNASNISSGTLAAARLATSGATAGSYGPSANASPAHGGTFSVPYVTVDTYGRVTAASTKTITLPADSNTDTKVTATATEPTSATSWYPICSTTNTTSTATTVKNPELRVTVLEGTASAEGKVEIVLGNSTASGTAGNKTGWVSLYNNKGKWTSVRPHTGDTENRSLYTPKAGGTLVCHTTDTAIGGTAKPVYVTAAGVATACSSDVGSATQPVYMDGGTITACTYTLSKSVPSDAVFTDTNTKVTSTATEPTSAATWYALCTTSSATATGTAVKNPEVRFTVLEGTASAAGYSRLYLGNTTATGTAGNKTGSILLYGATGKYAHIIPHDGDTANRDIYTPKSGGELVVHTKSTAIGSASKPVYVTAAGVVTACTSLETAGNVVMNGTANTNYLQLPSGIKLY